jgi:hypothetical protein
MTHYSENLIFHSAYRSASACRPRHTIYRIQLDATDHQIALIDTIELDNRVLTAAAIDHRIEQLAAIYASVDLFITAKRWRAVAIPSAVLVFAGSATVLSFAQQQATM